MTSPMTSPDEDPQYDQEGAMIKRAAQRYGTVGAMLAGGMVVFDKLLGRKPKEEAAVVVEASGEPGDIDTEGISFVLRDNTSVTSPPPMSRARARRQVRRRRRPNTGNDFAP